ncbi:hypothetical protein AB0215_29240, partial [Klebsiella pneumoniae]
AVHRRGFMLICRHIRLFMLKYIAWRNLLSLSILSGHTRGAAGSAANRSRWTGLSATSRGAKERAAE